MNIIVCEDNPRILEKTKALLSDFFAAKNIDFQLNAFSSYEKALKHIESMKKFDDILYILDIDLGSEKSGLLLGRRIREIDDYKGELIYVTGYGHQSNAVFKYKLRVLDFIDKNLDWQKELTETLESYLKIQARKIEQTPIVIKDYSKLFSIKPQDIIYIETSKSSKKITICTVRETTTVNLTLSEVLQKLPSSFIQIHRSILVNKAHISKIEKTDSNLYVTLSNGKIELVAKRREKGAQMYYLITMTCIHLFLIYRFTDEKVKPNLYAFFTFMTVLVLKPIVFAQFTDTFSIFLMAWLFIFFLGISITKRNIKVNIELALFINLLNALSYYFVAGIMILFGYGMKVDNVFNYAIINKEVHPLHTVLCGLVLILIGIFKRHIPMKFDLGIYEFKNLRNLAVLVLINLIVKILYDVDFAFAVPIILYVILNIAFLIISVRNNALSDKSMKDALALKEKERQIEEMGLYIGTIEALVERLRSYNHDFKNLIVAKTGVRESEYVSFLDEFRTESLGGKIYDAFLNLKDVKYLPLKSLLSYYIALCIRENIDVSLSIIGEVDRPNMPENDFSRMVGILLENATEEAMKCDEKRLEIFAEYSDGRLNLTIANTFRKDVLDKDRIFDKGYSTKGTGRGLGLFILKSTLDKNPNVSLDTFVEGDVFIQDMHVF